jgi:hypothetical protein
MSDSDELEGRGGLRWFGVTIGLMTALTETAGAVAALVGLLFALIGGSLLALYRGEDKVPANQRRLLFRQAGCVAAGILIGLFFGFGLRFVDNAVLRPLASLVASKIHAPATITGDARSKAASQPSNVALHGYGRQELLELAARCERLAEDAKTKREPNLTESDQSLLREFHDRLIQLNGLPQTVRQVQSLVETNRLSVGGKQALQTEVAEFVKKPITQALLNQDTLTPTN